MKRHCNLFPKIIDKDNLYTAYWYARKGKEALFFCGHGLISWINPTISYNMAFKIWTAKQMMVILHQKQKS